MMHPKMLWIFLAAISGTINCVFAWIDNDLSEFTAWVIATYFLCYTGIYILNRKKKR